MPAWNGCGIMLNEGVSLNSSIEFYTDASDIGFGIYFSGRWTAQRWPNYIQEDCRRYSFDWRELFFIYAAVTTHAGELRGHRLLFHTDNLPIVGIWQKGTSDSPLIMTLIRSILMTAALNEFTISFQHIPGILNTAADLLSRLKIEKFLKVAKARREDEVHVTDIIWNWQACPF